jgi:arylsulfatase A-like enzyme/Tfp pilus assembly protein PilF
MRRTAAIAGVVAAAGLAYWLIAGRRAATIDHAACRGCNVLLITIDTLRADRVGAFGSTAGLTPAIDRLAERGLKLTRAYSSAPLTLPSHASILTGVSPPRHGVRTNGLFRFGSALPTLATILKNAGYRTGAFIGAFVLDARFGLNRGFDVYDDRYGEPKAGEPADAAERRAEEVVKPAMAWITQQSNPQSPQSPNPSINPHSAIPNPHWFAWVHLYDPHEPYRAPEPYASQHAPYDAEVAYTDAVIGHFIADLDAAHQLDSTVIVLAADHGESLGEHGERSHGVFAYDATLRVPWIVWARDRIAPQTWQRAVRLIDLAPTTLDLVGVAAPAPFEGRSIVDAIDSRDTTDPPAYFEAMDANLTRNWAPLSGIVSGDTKLIDLPIPELYDLVRDPKETTNLFTRERERARTLTALLRSTAAGFGTAADAQQTTLSADARQRLQALGYVAASAAPVRRAFTDADDPKVMIGVANDLNEALAQFKRGDADPAMIAVRSIIQAHPAFSTAYGVLASMQHDTGNLPAAIATLETLVRRGAADQSVMVVLAGYLQEGGAAAKAASLLEAVVAEHPDYADAYNSLGVAYSRLGRHDKAQAAFNKVLELDPTSATAYENLGVDDVGRGDLESAVAHLRRAIEIDPRLARAHNVLAAAYMRQKRQAEAIAEWKLALHLDPRLYDALFNLGISLWDSGRQSDARPYLERFVAEAPPARYAPDIARLRRILQP